MQVSSVLLSPQLQGKSEIASGTRGTLDTRATLVKDYPKILCLFLLF